MVENFNFKIFLNQLFQKLYFFFNGREAVFFYFWVSIVLRSKQNNCVTRINHKSDKANHFTSMSNERNTCNKYSKNAKIMKP